MTGDTPFPPEVTHADNPPTGAIIYYSLGSKPEGEITLDIADAAGKPVRHLSSLPFAPIPDSLQAIPEFWKEIPRPLPIEIGTNRINWNIRYDSPPTFSHSYASVMGANAFQTPWSPEGPLALPGVYTLTLTVDGKRYTQTVTVKNDPRSPASAADLAAQHALQMKFYDGAKEAFEGFNQVAAMRTAVTKTAGSSPPVAVAAAITAFDAKLALAGGNAGGGGRGAGGGDGRGGQGVPPGAPPPTPPFATVIGSLNRLAGPIDFGDMAPTPTMLKTWLSGCTDLKAAVAKWESLEGKDLDDVNAVLGRNSLPLLRLPRPTLAVPTCTTGAGASPAAKTTKKTDT